MQVINPKMDEFSEPEMCVAEEIPANTLDKK